MSFSAQRPGAGTIPAPLPPPSPSTTTTSSSSESTTRVALITGAAQGLGLGIALRLASDGFDVALNDIPAKLDALNEAVRQIGELGDGTGRLRRAIVVVGDVSVETDVERMVRETVDAFGGLDVMVANAGIVHQGSITEVTVEDFDRVVGVNLRGVLLCYKHAARQMIKQGRGGRIIGASSVAGLQGHPLVPVYCATKFAVRGLTQVTAMELAPHRITVNCYAPGMIKTPMIAIGDHDEAYWKQQMGFEADMHIPGPEVVASAVSYICKPEAYYITGSTIGVSGGLIMH